MHVYIYYILYTSGTINIHKPQISWTFCGSGLSLQRIETKGALLQLRLPSPRHGWIAGRLVGKTIGKP